MNVQIKKVQLSQEQSNRFYDQTKSTPEINIQPTVYQK